MTISIRMLNCKGIEEQYTLSKKWNRVSSHLDKEVREKKESSTQSTGSQNYKKNIWFQVSL